MDRIVISGMQFFGRHGVHAHEAAHGQVFGVDVELHLDLAAGGVADDPGRTVDYGAVFAEVRSVVEGPRVRLVEALAEAIAGRLLERFPVDAVTVRVHKPRAPIPGTFADVCVEIHRRQAARPRQHPTGGQGPCYELPAARYMTR
ncbi:dihydroneopterin aldolase [Caldinitratiruptor microaerophilus]|uniref:7,8-dihydroneopterin aldolase n=1 Tax=Caldinitratiruptor microaerophilus TaxID=671077 RepID=A0AA35G602_9FIRM|nr:dihydroneopterin aldolase [Caldinitratiruptor microaerophilus]BDG60466.1 7,8-dihydroneopterin aldolase [Caldinitratiruptor microaerophilus]